MHATRIPRNPNSTPPHGNQGLQPHWGRIFILLVAALLCLVFARPRFDEVRSNAAFSSTSVAQRTVWRSPPQSLRATFVPQPSPEEQVRAAVDRANRAFSAARAQADITPLLSVATDDWLAQEQAYIASLRGKGQLERWHLISFAIRDMAIRDSAAVVCTTERWEKTALNTDGSADPSTSLTFLERYTLQQQGTGWLVAEVRYGEESCAVA